MKRVKGMLMSVTCLVFLSSPVWACNQPGGCESDATAISNSNSEATAVLAPVLNPEANSSASAESTVGINNNPTNVNQAAGGVGIGVGGQGGQGGHANAAVYQDFSSKNNKVYNRQHIMPSGAAPASQVQMYDEWERNEWNVNHIVVGAFTAGEVDVEIEILKQSERIYKKMPATKEIMLRGYLYDPTVEDPAKRVSYYPPTGRKIGFLNVVLPEDGSTDDALLYTAARGMEVGADQVVVRQWGGRKTPTASSVGIGLGGSGAALFGPDEQIAGAVGGGTHWGTSSVVKESQPFLSVEFWKNGESAKPSPVAGGPSPASKTDDGKKLPVKYLPTN